MNSLFQQISETIGILPDTTDKEAQLLSWANRGARMLFDRYDLPGTVFEQFFCFDRNAFVISFPWYVGAIRGIRLHNSSRKLTLNDMRPRYNYSPWVQPYLKWRQMSPSPLSSALTQSGTLTFTIPEAYTEPFTITVVGQTATASSVVENITFNVGDTTKTSTNQWSQEAPFGVREIKKSTSLPWDVAVTLTATGATVSTIPNNQPSVSFIRVQILDWNLSQQYIYGEDCLEILYKGRFMPLTSIDDSWIDARFDDVLVHAVKYLWAMEKKDYERAQVEEAYWMKLSAEIVANVTENQEILITCDKNPYANAAVRYPFYPNFNVYDRL